MSGSHVGIMDKQVLSVEIHYKDLSEERVWDVWVTTGSYPLLVKLCKFIF